MKKSLLLALVVMVALAGCKKKDTSMYIAMVNGEGVEKAFFEKQISQGLDQFQKAGRPVSETDKAGFRKMVLDNLIDRRLLLQKAAELKLTVADDVVGKRMDEVRGQFPNPEEFKKALAARSMQEPELRTMIKEQLSIEELLQKQVVSSLSVTDADVKAFYDRDPKMFNVPERVRVSHVLLKYEGPETTPEAAQFKTKLEGIRKQVVDKKIAFADAAKQFSDCPSKTQGGDLGVFTRGQMVPEFDKVAFAGEIGAISPVFHTQFGYHFLTVTEKKPAGIVSFEEAAPQIKNRLMSEKQNEGIKTYVEGLRKAAKIESFLPAPPPAAPAAPAPAAPVPAAPEGK
jgi:peptidyl-prolyl cis-trans isomerase C